MNHHYMKKYQSSDISPVGYYDVNIIIIKADSDNQTYPIGR